MSGILAELGSGAVGGIFGGIGSLIKDVRTAWTGEIPPDKRAEFEQKLLELEQKAMDGQITINLEEARSERLWVSGWRPACGWIGAASLAYASIIEPFITWTARLCGSTVTFPVLNTEITLQILIGILGLSAARSFDKKQQPNVLGKE